MTSEGRPVSWIIGRGGLLGRGTERAMARTTEIFRPSILIPWTETAARGQLTAVVDEFTDRARGREWRLAWCAGAGVVGSTPESLAVESTMLETVLERIGLHIDRSKMGRGALFVASSAGGVYAGSSHPPFDERTTPRPLSPYGEVKLRLESMAADWATAHPVPVLIGRISNLYGPGQNLQKPQGLISQLCWKQLVQQPIGIYVPLDTIRDYLFAPDCGEMIFEALTHVARATEGGAPPVLKVLASQRPTTVGTLLGEFKRVMRRNVRVSVQRSDVSRFQTRDLRLVSGVLREVDRLASTLLPEGLHVTHDDLRRRLAVAGAGRGLG